MSRQARRRTDLGGLVGGVSHGTMPTIPVMATETNQGVGQHLHNTMQRVLDLLRWVDETKIQVA
jgi:hypothetical protein